MLGLLLGKVHSLGHHLTIEAIHELYARLVPIDMREANTE